MPSSTIRCPQCGHVLATIDLPQGPASQPSGPLASTAPVLLRIAEAAALLSVSRSTLYQLINKGTLPVVRIGASIRVARHELDRLAEGRTGRE